ncbi:MAG: MATE family efflux transporter [Clostridia bacterium]|nr:MATE family efflux transporter [Clostridia bacterium]
MKVRNMTAGSPLKLLLAVAFPLMIGNVFQQMYTVVDAQVLGQAEGYETLAALGTCDWLNWLFFGLIQGLTMGFTIPMAQAFGANDEKALKRYVGNSTVLGLIISVALSAVAIFCVSPILSLLKVEQELRPIATSYVRVLFVALPVVMAYNLLAGILRSMGDGKTPLYAMAVASIVNIGLDYLFVMGLHWGVVGAAIATVIAQICSCVFCFLKLKNFSMVRPAKADFILHANMCRKLISLGVPVAAQNMIIAVGGLIILRVVNPLGAVFMAGYTSSSKLYGILEIAAVSFGYATSAYAGQNFGAGKRERIWKGVHVAAVMGVITAFVISLCMFTFGSGFISSFITGEDPEEVKKAIGIGCEFLYIMSGALPILYLLYVYRAALQGMGDTLVPMLSGLAEFVMRTLAALILPGLIGYLGVFWAEALAWFGADVILIPAYYLTMRKLKMK